MRRVKTKGLPVVDAEGNFKGALKYKDAVKAAQQGKQAQRVKAWARREALTCAPDLFFTEIENIFLTQTSGRIAVVDDEGKLLGLITRTDVLRQHNLYSALTRRTR